MKAGDVYRMDRSKLYSNYVDKYHGWFDLRLESCDFAQRRWTGTVIGNDNGGTCRPVGHTVTWSEQQIARCGALQPSEPKLTVEQLAKELAWAYLPAEQRVVALKIARTTLTALESVR